MAPDQALKDLIKGVGDLSLLTSDVIHGFSLSEIPEGLAVMNDIQAVLADAPNLLTQYKGLDDTARADLEAFISQNVTFPSDVTVQMWIERVLGFAISLSSLLSLGVSRAKA